MSLEKKSLTIVLPLFNEKDSISKLLEEITNVLLNEKILDYEILIIDDGSTDGSWVEIEKICSTNKKVLAYKLKKNYGKSIALNVGFDIAKKDYIITLDADLQDDPKEIPNFIKALEKSDFVSGWKKFRNDPISKTIPSKIFNFITKTISKVNLNDFNCGYKAYKKEVIKNLNLYGELHRYIPLLLVDLGYSVSELEVNHRPRIHGKSKFGFERYYRGFIDLITVTATTKFLRRPGHLFGGIGLFFGVLGSLILIYLLSLWILTNFFDFTLGSIGNRPLLFLGILSIITSVQLLSLSIISELFLKSSKKTETKSYIKDKINESIKSS